MQEISSRFAVPAIEKSISVPRLLQGSTRDSRTAISARSTLLHISGLARRRTESSASCENELLIASIAPVWPSRLGMCPHIRRFRPYVMTGDEIAYASAFFRNSSVLSHAVFVETASYTSGRASFMKACCAS